MRKINLILSIFLILGVTLAANSCNTLKDLANAASNISKLQFKLIDVDNFRLAGVDISKKSSVSDISITDALKLTNAFATKSFPAEFVLNVAAKNPNDGTNGSKKSDATISSLDYRLLIDDVPTITGDISAPIGIPGNGQSVEIPLKMGLDLYQFFGNKGYESIANLALAIGGVSGTPARLKLDMKPTVKTSFGPISYPSRLTIIDKEWR
ncbi:MAG TPA: hypothetical protein PLE30_10835 [Candidatus Kapabacteria bacterium]|nr:hypothetical protein [Candidatus Kapabacteria bacterium]